MDDDDTNVPVPVKKEAPKAEVDLLGDEPSKPPAESIIDINMPSQIPSQIPPQDDFNTMRNMFSTMNVNQPAPQQAPSSVDFFAEEPKKEVPPPQSAINFDLNLTGSTNPPPSNFSTGLGLLSSNTNAKAFATSSPGNKPLEVDFFNLPPKQDANASMFSKKPAEQPTSQMENIFSGQPEKPVQSQVSSPLTDLNVNDFMATKPKESEVQINQSNIQAPPSAGDFSTLQNFFQTSNPSTLQGMSMNQPSGISMGGSSIGAPGQVPNEGDFNTLQNMFQTTNYSNLSNNNPPSQIVEQKAPVAPIASSTNKSNTNVFATMGGGTSASSNF